MGLAQVMVFSIDSSFYIQTVRLIFIFILFEVEIFRCFHIVSAITLTVVNAAETI
jgi:hypothetical protein